MTEALTDERAILWIAALLYCAGFGYVLTFLLLKRKHSRVAGLILVSLGFVLQTVGLYLRGLKVESCPLGNIFEIVQFLTWSLIFLYLAIGPAFRVSLLGFFSSGFAATLGLLSLVVSPWDEPYQATAFGGNPWIEVHAATALFSYGVFALLFLTAAMYLLQNHGLRAKRFTGLFSILPSIVQLDQINRRLLLTGVLVLTFSLIVGANYWMGAWDQVALPKLLFTVATWAAYTTLLFLHFSRRMLGQRFALLCVAIFLLTLVSIWPVNESRFAQTGIEVLEP